MTAKSVNTQPVQDSAFAFVCQVMSANVVDLITASSRDAEQAKRKETSSAMGMAQASELVFAQGGRVAHFKETEGESAEDKALRLEMVRMLDKAIIAGMSAIYRKALEIDVKGATREANKQAKKADKNAKRIVGADLFSAETLEAKKNASTHKTVYKSRFIAYLEKLENPKVEEDKADPVEESKAEKTQEQLLLEDLVSARGHAMKCAPSDKIGQMIEVLAVMIGELGGSVE